MSYNTRRTGGAAPGSGRSTTPTTQVNYHQQPATRTGNAAQSRNPGYSTTPQPGYNSTGYNTQSQPAFTTQPPTPAPPAAQPKPPQQPPSVQPPSTPAPPKPPAPQPQQTPTPQFKQEPITPVGTPQNTQNTSTTSTEATENGEPSRKPPYWKKSNLKLSHKAKRARLNAKLRRTLNPKTALTFLNELRSQPGGVKFVVREEAGWGYNASVDIDGKLFSGHGITVNKAKSVAAEQALKYLLLERMSKSAKPTPATGDKEEAKDCKKEDGENKEEKMDVDKKEGEGEPEAKKAKPEDNYENELPWGSLAAFALHKLFAEWQREGITEWQRESAEMPYPDKFEEDTSEDHFPARRALGPVDEYGYAAPGPRRFRPYHPPRGRGFGPFPGPRGHPSNFRMARPPGPPPAATFLGNFKASGFPVPGSKPPVLLPMRKIPEDANTRHPVMLLNQLKPQVVYNEEKEGDPPRDVFKITVEHEGQEFVGRGKSKKEAKKQAAKAVLATMGVHYPDDV